MQNFMLKIEKRRKNALSHIQPLHFQLDFEFSHNIRCFPDSLNSVCEKRSEETDQK